MAQIILFSLVAVSSVWALLDWRRAIFLVLLVGAIQDPLRKLTPNAPSYLVLATVPIWLVLSFRALGQAQIWKLFQESYRQLSSVMLVFLLSLLPAAFISASYGPGTWKLTLIGLFSYGTFLLGWVVGFSYTRSFSDIHRILTFYCIVSAVMLLGTPLEYFDLWPDWSALGTRAMGTRWIRFAPGYYVVLTAGFYRSPDIMGWHAITVGMLATTLSFASNGINRYFWILIAGWGVFAAVLCGRRKMVMMIPVFILVLLWLYLRSKSAGQLAGVLAVLLGVSITAFAGYEWMGSDESIERYYSTPMGEVAERVRVHGWRALSTTFQQSGFFGEGLGTASQGSQHLTAARPRTWQEGGLGKVMVELGVPGLFCFLFLNYLLFKSIFQRALRCPDPDSSAFSLAAGLAAFSLANAGSFLVSQQVFGDPFVMTFFSLLIGLLLSTARYRTGRESAPMAPDSRY